jgi:hypothetical protein
MQYGLSFLFDRPCLELFIARDHGFKIRCDGASGGDEIEMSDKK